MVKAHAAKPMIYRFLLSLGITIAGVSSAHAGSDVMPRMLVAYYFHAFYGEKDEETQISRLSVINYLAGIRDHLWWQCEYETTVMELSKAAEFQIQSFQAVMNKEQFMSWAGETPFGDMVFLALKDEKLLGKPEPCKSQ